MSTKKKNPPKKAAKKTAPKKSAPKKSPTKKAKKPTAKPVPPIVKALIKMDRARTPKPRPMPTPVTAKPAVAVKPILSAPPPAKVVNPNRSRIAQNGITRPSATWGNGKPKTTFRVWQIADEISAANKKAADEETKRTGQAVKAKPASRQQVLAACQAEGITYATFSNQYYHWRKFNGLFGRVKKDGTVATVTGGPRKFRKGGDTPAAKPPVVATKPSVPAKPLFAPAKPLVTSKPVFPFPVRGVNAPAAPSSTSPKG